MSGNAPTYRVYEFGDFRLDPARRLLTRANGDPVPITAKPFDALVHLVERAGNVVPRRDLAQALWPAQVVEDNNLSQAVLALRRALGDTQDAPRFVATIPRRGYQFVAAVRRTRVRSAPPGSIAVLPFENLSPLDEHGYFAAGMHDELLNHLARIHGLEVKGRTSMLRYAHTATPIETIVRELGVAAVLEGSVRYAAKRVRVSVRLVDGESGTEVWSETYDETLDDVFRIQGDIAARIAAELAEALTPAERSSIAAPQTGSLEAYSLYLQALALYRARGGIGVSMPTEARESLERLLTEALTLDPDFAAALGWRAHVTLDALLFDPLPAVEWDRRSAASIERMERDAFRALELDPRNPAPCTPLVLGLRALGDHAAAVEAARAMIENAPAAPIGYIALARAETGRRDPERILEALRLAERCFDETTRNFRADAAVFYACVGAHGDAERLIYEFERVNGSGRVEPGLAVMTRLALRDYATAQAILEQAIAARAVGMDPIPCLLIRRNTWADPVLEEPKWRQLRARLGPRGNGADA